MCAQIVRASQLPQQPGCPRGQRGQVSANDRIHCPLDQPRDHQIKHRDQAREHGTSRKKGNAAAHKIHGQAPVGRKPQCSRPAPIQFFRMMICVFHSDPVIQGTGGTILRSPSSLNRQAVLPEPPMAAVDRTASIRFYISLCYSLRYCYYASRSSPGPIMGISTAVASSRWKIAI